MFGVGSFCNPVLTNEVVTKAGFSSQKTTYSRATLNVTKRLYGFFDQFILHQ